MPISLTQEQLWPVHLIALGIFVLLLFTTTLSWLQASRQKKSLSSQSSKLSRLQQEFFEAENEAREANRRTQLLKQRLDRLAPYESMPDAFSQLESERADVQQMLKDARKKARDVTEESNLVLRQARERADSVLFAANERAEEIAGDAWAAKGQLEFFENTVVAMKNKIEGYGDQYLIPNETLLDDLAEDYEHEEAGRQLKIVREQVKALIRDGKAADCDYKEATRRQKSIEFVLDAFNGKAETILAKVNKDNYGVMKKKLEDAYQLVNYNGKPFKNARILPRYADLYQAQLKYSIQVRELKQRDKDEQRRIKAEMREEERVQRELKKAQQQALKEEKIILKAVKEAEMKLEKSAEVDRLQYQSQLEALKEKLTEAEARNLRAKSMAEQTKQGHVYVVSNVGSFGENVFKVGMTRRLEPMDRIKELSDASVPFNFDVHAIIFSDDAPKLENILHSKFSDRRVNRVNLRKEFFHVYLGEVRAEVESMNLNCKWTMKAEALEFRESAQVSRGGLNKTPETSNVLELG